MSQPVPQPGTYALDPDLTTIRADVKAMFGLVTVHGTFRLKDGQVTIAEDPAASRVRAVIDAGSFASGNQTRDTDVVSASLLDAKAYPEISFDGTGARQDGPGWLVSGSVTAHGTTVPAEFRVTRNRGRKTAWSGSARPPASTAPASASPRRRAWSAGRPTW